MNVLSDNDVIARKQYIDDAYRTIIYLYEDGLYEYSDLREIVKAKKQNGKILPGQKYRRLVYKENDKLITWRESLPMSKIMHKYELYEDC